MAELADGVAEQPTPPPPERSPAPPPLSSGDHGRQLIQQQLRRLAKLRPEVLADHDPEPLHQLRVSLRRLRTALGQFAPALDLPAGVDGRGIAALARRTGRCRDLDVLRLRLRDQLLPRLPASERRRLAGAMGRLERERTEAFATLVETLQAGRYRRLLKRLHRWQQRPRFTALGVLPLAPWLFEWQAPFSAGLFLDPGWRAVDPADDALHGLRKRIKGARYALEHLEGWCEPPLLRWVGELRQAQGHLGELHDLQVLQASFAASRRLRALAELPVLRAELQDQQTLHWQRWRELALRLQADHNRQALHRQLLELGREAPLAVPAGEAAGRLMVVAESGG
jgi:CHAD domain-containing protein